MYVPIFVTNSFMSPNTLHAFMHELFLKTSLSQLSLMEVV